MTAEVIKLPIVARITASGDFEDVTLPGLRLPRRVYARLRRVAESWNVEPGMAAEMLLLNAINEAAGIRKR